MRPYRLTLMPVMLLLIAAILAGCSSNPQTGQDAGQSAGQAVAYNPVGNANPDLQPTPVVNWPMLHSNTVDASEVTAVKAAVEHTHRVRLDVAVSFDITPLDSAYVDDPRVPLTAPQAQFIEQVRQAQGTAVADELKGSGYLTCMKAFYLNWKRGAEGWREITTQAKNEGRQVTADDIKSITGTVGMPMQANDPSNYSSQSFTNPTPYDYRKIVIEGDEADVIYLGEGPALYHVFMVKTSAGWKEAGLTPAN
jgi:hypothetical protein